ncbi:TPA: nitrate/nitrite transporter [Klebsiella oxytoca]
MRTRRVIPSRKQEIARTACVAIVFTLFCSIVFGFGFYLFSLLSTVMRKSLGFEYATMGIITGAAQISFLIASLLCPSITHRFGTGRVIISGTAAAALLLMSLAAVQNTLQAGIVVTGLGITAAFMMIPTVDAVTQSVPSAFQSRVHGLISSGTAYGQLANGMIVPWLLPDHSWRLIWFTAGSASLLITAMGLVALKFMAPEIFVRNVPLNKTSNVQPMGASKIATVRNLMVWALLALCGMACGPWQNYLSSFLTTEHGQSLAVVGHLWSIIGALGLFSGFLAGVIADKVGIKFALILSYITLACSAFLVAVNSETWHLRASAICFGLSFYAVYGLIPAYISKTVDSRSGTKVFAIANVFLGLGTTFGNVVGGQIPSWFGSLQGIFILAGSLSLIGALITLILKDERRVAHEARSL